VNGDPGGKLAELLRRRLRGSQHEQDVLESTLPSRSSGATRRLGHRRGVGIDPDHEGGRLRSGHCEHGSTITGADIDRHPPMAANDLGDLADVHLDEAPSDD
jgi:hypothetical protein